MTAREITIDPKSIIGLTKLNIVKGTNVTVLAVGEDEQEAVETITEFVASDIDVEQRYRNAFKGGE
jgi:phosphotransferase system HPr (HPr) family protein